MARPWASSRRTLRTRLPQRAGSDTAGLHRPYPTADLVRILACELGLLRPGSCWEEQTDSSDQSVTDSVSVSRKNALHFAGSRMQLKRQALAGSAGSLGSGCTTVQNVANKDASQ